MSKSRARPSADVPVKPRHKDAWGAILNQSPYRNDPSGTQAPGNGNQASKPVSPSLLTGKGLVFVANSDGDLRDFPQVARQRVGYQLHLLQTGQNPSDWTPTVAVGLGCAQIRVYHSGETYRLSYVASIGDTVYVLHASQKQGPQTAESDLALGQRYEQMSALIQATQASQKADETQ